LKKRLDLIEIIWSRDVIDVDGSAGRIF